MASLVVSFGTASMIETIDKRVCLGFGSFLLG